MASMEHKTPSFSSTLLDAIYRSIDDSGEQEEAMRKKQSQEDMANFQRACLIEKWMEKKRVNISSEYDASSFFNSSSSSSDFSSYEADSMYGVSSYHASSCYGLNTKPKPIRTTVLSTSVQEKPKPKTGGFVSTKSRALKIYTELKKARQPISPGGRLATFLNSIFTPGNTKKATVSSEKKTKSANASNCSSASSFSRSCLSKTPSSRNGLKRSVRFYDENLQQKQQVEKKTDIMDVDLEMVKKNIRAHVLEKNLRVEDLLRNFQAKKLDEEDDDDDDDAASYASSDLFELDNLSAIGMDQYHQRYHEELPVYETTHLGTNRAIAKGLIL